MQRAKNISEKPNKRKNLLDKERERERDGEKRERERKRKNKYNFFIPTKVCIKL